MFSEAVLAFASEIGTVDPVVAVGSRSRYSALGAREVVAPSGVVEHVPEELTVRVLAGTPVSSLQAALAERGQRALLPVRSPASTVGGVLAAGLSPVERLGWGHVRDSLLEATVVLADGRVARCGGPTVKNVSGYDVCRLLVGSWGTLACFAEVVLRTRPLPRASSWFVAPAPAVVAQLWKPASALWDGTSTWVLLEGHPADVAAQASSAGLVACPGPPSLDDLPHRWSVPVADLASLAGRFVAELGVGVVHRAEPAPRRQLDPAAAAVQARLKASFDPTGRLAPGRSVP